MKTYLTSCWLLLGYNNLFHFLALNVANKKQKKNLSRSPPVVCVCQMKTAKLFIVLINLCSFFIFYLPFVRQNYERLNLADALAPKTFRKGDKIITQGKYMITKFKLSCVKADGITNSSFLDKSRQNFVPWANQANYWFFFLPALFAYDLLKKQLHSKMKSGHVATQHTSLISLCLRRVVVDLCMHEMSLEGKW
jgi:hypothetical protein